MNRLWKSYIGLKDPDWYEFLSNLPAVDEVNFWQPHGKNTEELRPKYREIVRAAVKNFEPELGAGTDYHIFKKVYEQWSDT